MNGPHDHDHGHGHDHGHAGDLRDVSRRRLFVALALTGTFLIVEVGAGVLSGSLALLSDAGHMLTDAGALGLALWAQSLSTRPRSDRKTFGYRRAEILAAAANGIVLGITAVGVIVEAIRRLPSLPASTPGSCSSSRPSVSSSTSWARGISLEAEPAT